MKKGAKILKMGSNFWKGQKKIFWNGQNFENGVNIWKWGNIGQNFGNQAKCWKLGNMLETGQNSGNRAKFWKLGKILEIGQNFENRAKFWKKGQNFEMRAKFGNSAKIWKFGQNFEKGAKFWKSGKILIIGQNFEIRATFWKLGKILKIGQFWKFWSARHIPPKISPTNPRVIYQMTRARYFLPQIFWDKWRAGTNDARAWNARRYAMFTRGPPWSPPVEGVILPFNLKSILCLRQLSTTLMLYKLLPTFENKLYLSFACEMCKKQHEHTFLIKKCARKSDNIQICVKTAQ